MVTRVIANGFQNRYRFHKRHLFSKKMVVCFGCSRGGRSHGCASIISEEIIHRSRLNKAHEICCIQEVWLLRSNRMYIWFYGNVVFAKQWFYTQREECKRKNYKILHVKHTPKNHTAYGFIQGCPAHSWYHKTNKNATKDVDNVKFLYECMKITRYHCDIYKSVFLL